MLVEKLHADEVDIDLTTIGELIADQYPDAEGLLLVEVVPAGTSNVMLRLGDQLVVRLPRNADAATSLEKEWLYPTLFAASLPVPISVPLFVGEPGSGYPFAWSISTWLPGERATPADGTWPLFALDLARFVAALHSIKPPADIHLDAYRGEPIGLIDREVRDAIDSCERLLDTPRLTEAWDHASLVTERSGRRVWLHTDLQPGNILANDGRLAAVVDWGGLAIGDESVDLIVAWNLLDPLAREIFRTELDLPESTWLRGRAWAFAIGVIAYPYYVDSNPALAAISKYQIEQVIADIGL
jgi:aminoglycoside phosphotransferase (APT) family kinase protein